MGRLALSKGKGPPVAPDTTPNAIVFADNLAAALDTDIIVRATLSGTNANASLTVLSTSTSYSINGGDYATTLPVDVPPGATIDLKRHSSSSNSTSTNVGCTVGGVVSSGGTITTVAADTTPDAGTFTAQTNVEPLATLTFGPLTLTGYDTAATMTALASGTSGYSFDGSTFSTSLPIPVPVGTQLWLERTASPLYSTDSDVGCTISGVQFTGHGRTKADPAITVVGPHASWDGTAASGATAPTDGVRVNAKAIAAFMQPSYQRMSAGQQFDVSVKAGAFGGFCATAGIATVRFRGGCADADVATPICDLKTNRLGGTNPEVVYKIKLDADAFLAQHPAGGAVTIYAEATTVDATVVNRVISIIVYVYPDAEDWVGTFSLDGRSGSYTGLYAGMNAMRAAVTAGAKNAKLSCIQDGDYDADDCPSGYSGYVTPAGGYVTISGSGFNCKIKRDALPSVNDASTWSWFTGFNGVHWQDVTVDNAYLTTFKSHNNSSRPDWYDGVKWTDSLGRDRLMQGASHPGRGHEGLQSQGFDAYYTDSYAEEGPSPFGFSLLATGIRTYRTCGDMYSGARVVMNTYDKDSTSAWFSATYDAMTLAYSGSSSTIAKTGLSGEAGSNGGFGNKGVWAVVDDTGSATLQFVKYASEVNVGTGNVRTWADVAAWFNARTGYTAVVTDTTGRLAAYAIIGAYGTTQNWPAKAVTSTPLTISSIIDFHGDWYQSGTTENVIISGCVLATSGAEANDYSGGLFIGRNDDMLIENMIMDAKYSNNVEPGSGFTHLIIENCDMIIAGLSGPTSGFTDPHSRVSRNVLDSVNSFSPNQPYINDNYAQTGSFGTGTNTSGNYTGGTMADQYVDLAGKDYRKNGQVLAAIRAQTAISWDILGNERAANDVDGAVSVNQTFATTWPSMPLAV